MKVFQFNKLIHDVASAAVKGNKKDQRFKAKDEKYKKINSLQKSPIKQLNSEIKKILESQFEEMLTLYLNFFKSDAVPYIS